MSAILSFLKAITPLVIQQLIAMAATNIGGFRFWLLKKIIQYGGKELIKSLNEAIYQAERDEAQKKAKEELDKIKQDPSTTPEQLGEAYEKYFNTSRNPRNDSSAGRMQ